MKQSTDIWLNKLLNSHPENSYNWLQTSIMIRIYTAEKQTQQNLQFVCNSSKKSLFFRFYLFYVFKYENNTSYIYDKVKAKNLEALDIASKAKFFF